MSVTLEKEKLSTQESEKNDKSYIIKYGISLVAVSYTHLTMPTTPYV